MAKVALVTGGAKGIGEAIIKKLASKGYDVCINFNHSEDEAKKLKSFVEKKFNVNAKVYKADISQ